MNDKFMSDKWSSNEDFHKPGKKDRLRELTAKELQTLFEYMSIDEMQLIVDALRALAGDTESFEKLQRLHVSIEQPINKLLDLAKGFENPVTDYNPESRFFRPSGGFTNGKRFIEVRLVEPGKHETLIHYHNGTVLFDEKGLYSFEYIMDCVNNDGMWEEVCADDLKFITDPEIPS